MPIRDPGAEARLHLLSANRDGIAVMLAGAAGARLAPEDAVVVIVDQRDPVGVEIAQTAAEEVGIDAATEAERIQDRGEIPTVILVMPLAGARVLFAESHPEVARGLMRRPAASQVRVVVIAEGAAMLIHAEVSTRRGMPTTS